MWVEETFLGFSTVAAIFLLRFLFALDSGRSYLRKRGIPVHRTKVARRREKTLALVYSNPSSNKVVPTGPSVGSPFAPRGEHADQSSTPNQRESMSR